MHCSFALKALGLACAAVVLLGRPAICRAQMNNQSAGPNLMQETNSAEERLWVGTADTEADRQRNAAYERFLKEKDPAKKLRLANSFLEKYPKARSPSASTSK